MKNMLQQYLKVMGTTLVGLAFGFSFFYLFLNFYHYQEIRRTVYFNPVSDSTYLKINKTLDRVSNKISSLNIYDSNSTMSISERNQLKNKLKSCVSMIDTEKLNSLKEKNQIDIKDVYELYDSYEKNVLNNCIITNLSSFVTPGKIENQTKEILQSYQTVLIQDTSYLKKDLFNNGTYHFSTDSTTVAIKNRARDGFYEVLSAYNRAADFLEIVTDYYISELEGVQE